LMTNVFQLVGLVCREWRYGGQEGVMSRRVRLVGMCGGLEGFMGKRVRSERGCGG
jgi:hypothetical protein